MVNFKFIDFRQNLNQCVIVDNCNRNTLFLCPNHASLQELQFIYQKYATFNGSEFLTMDNFKLRCLNIPSPLLKEEKRILAFYAAMKPQYREKFHISNYFQSVNFAQDFFIFFDELAEEQIPTSSVYDKINPAQSADNWQTENYRILLDIKEDYLSYISERNFTDLIFIKKYDNMRTSWLSLFQNIVVVNQFYFTALEKQLLEENNAQIYLQIPENIYDKKKLCCLPEFSAAHLEQHLTKSIQNHIYTDEFSLKHSLFDQLDTISPELIIDFGILRQHLENYDCRHLLNGSSTRSFFGSSLFQFYEQLHTILSSITFHHKKYLMPLNTLISTFNNEYFFYPFLQHCFPQLDASQLEQNRGKLLTFIYYLAERDYKYIDLITIVPHLKIEPEILEIFAKLRILIDNYTGFKNINDLVIALTSDDCLMPQKIISPIEDQFTDLIEAYYQMIEDFSSLDKMEIFSDWNSIFPLKKSNKYFNSSQFLRLFLEFTKSKSFRYTQAKSTPKTWQLSTLHNTRNLQFKTIIIADTIEGVIPPNRQTPFLLTEFQRKELNLKTYDDIVLREKYYFFRLIATSENVHCFSRTSPADRTEISSFLEELHIAFPKLYKSDSLPQSTRFSGLCTTWLKPASPSLSAPVLPNNFFTLPFRKAHDLKNGNVFVSPSNISKLIEHPFSYYLDNLLYIRKRTLEIEMDYTPLQIGNLVHEAFNNVWDRIIELKAAHKGQQPFCYNQPNYAERALENLLISSQRIILQKPYNHSDRYFDKVICPMITESIIEFLKICDEKYTGIPITILPEKGNKNQSKELFKIKTTPIILKGRADLRIEIPSTGKKHIYDYKSGKSSSSGTKIYNTQLIMYEHLYYPNSVNAASWLFFVTGQELKTVSIRSDTKTKFLDDMLEGLQESLETTFDTGYQLGDKPDPYENDDITRRLLAKQLRSQL
jgi:ATP-dependent helicase/nuclease subunit B